MTDTTTYTRLKDSNTINFARALWLLAVSIVIYTYLTTLPALFQSRMITWESARPVLETIGISLETYVNVIVGIFVVLALTGVTGGIVIMLARSNNWLVMLISFAIILIPMATSVTPPWMQLLATVTVIPIWFLFPDGHFTPRWTRYAVILIFAIAALRALLNLQTTGTSPFVAVVLLIGSMAQYQRYRYHATPVEKQQLKLVAASGIQLMIAAILLTAMQAWVFNTEKTLLKIALFMAVSIFSTIAAATAIFSITNAILRRGLYGADVILHGSLVYGGITLILMLLFSIGFFGVHTLTTALTGGENQTVPAVVATAAVMMTFSPARHQLQRFVDRRLFGLRVDLEVLQQLHEQKTTHPERKGIFSGVTIAGYKIGSLLGHGGMAEVYQGIQSSLGRPVAIKILNPEIAEKDELRQRFEREAKSVATLRHPNIVNIFDFGDIELNNAKTYYIAMEYVDGRDLSDELVVRETLPVDEVAPIVRDIAAALDYAHMQNIIHRDVKPSNVMLQRVTTTGSTRPFKAVLMDFGILKMMDTVGNQLTTTEVMGTADYVAPEQILSSKEVDHRADIYSLGVMTYQMLTGHLPFKGSIAHVIFAHLQQPPPDPREVNPNIPDSVALAVMRAMGKNPDDRYQTAGDFAKAIS